MDIIARGCDWCAASGRAPDGVSRSIAIRIEDGPLKRLDLCEQHEDFFKPILAAYDAATTIEAVEQAAELLQASAAGEPPVYAVTAAKQEQLAIEAPAVTIPAQKPSEQADEKGPEFICLDCTPGLSLARSSLHEHARNTHKKELRDIKWGGWGKLPEQRPLGRKKKGVPSVVCPLEHRTGAEKNYWVPLKDRGAHAGSHGLKAPEIAWKNPDGIELPHVCTEPDHAECVAAGGFGFLTHNALATHKFKMAEVKKKQEAAEAELRPT